jgi:hypothetical protein
MKLKQILSQIFPLETFREYAKIKILISTLPNFYYSIKCCAYQSSAKSLKKVEKCHLKIFKDVPDIMDKKLDILGQDASKLLLDEIEFFALNLSIHFQHR